MAVGGNFIVRKSALEAVGGFNCEIPFYGEDTDIAQRLSAVGRVLFRMGFYNNTSARRFIEEGTLLTCARYAMNFVWPVLFDKQPRPV